MNFGRKEWKQKMAQIKKFGVLQTAKTAAVMHFVITLIFVIPFGLISLIAGFATGGREGIAGGFLGGIFMIFAPIIYAILGFVFVALGCLLYNFIAKYIGGIEIEIE